MNSNGGKYLKSSCFNFKICFKYFSIIYQQRDWNRDYFFFLNPKEWFTICFCLSLKIHNWHLEHFMTNRIELESIVKPFPLCIKILLTPNDHKGNVEI